MKLDVVEVRRSEGIATESCRIELVFEIVVGLAAFHGDLQASHEQGRGANDGVNNHAPSIIRHVLDKFDVRVSMLHRICLAMSLVVIDDVRLNARATFDGKGA